MLTSSTAHTNPPLPILKFYKCSTPRLHHTPVHDLKCTPHKRQSRNRSTAARRRRVGPAAAADSPMEASLSRRTAPPAQERMRRRTCSWAWEAFWTSQASRPLEVTTSQAPGAMATATSSADDVLMVGSLASWGVALVGDIGGHCGISPGASR
jgi:hypothetical protein